MSEIIREVDGLWYFKTPEKFKFLENKNICGQLIEGAYLAFVKDPESKEAIMNVKQRYNIGETKETKYILLQQGYTQSSDNLFRMIK